MMLRGDQDDDQDDDDDDVVDDDDDDDDGGNDACENGKQNLVSKICRCRHRWSYRRRPHHRRSLVL